MSLQDFKMPKLIDKHEEEAKKAEKVREKEEKKDEKKVKVINKGMKISKRK